MEPTDRIRSSVVVTPTGCWEWAKNRSPRGYGKIEVGGKDWRAHRFSYVVFVGPVPADLCVCHRCDNPPCVNPDHLFLGTHQENQDDKVQKGRQARGDQHYARTNPEKLARGDSHGMTKLSDAQVVEIRARYTGKWGEITRMAREYGVSRDLVHGVVHNKLRQNVGPGRDRLVTGYTGASILDRS